MPVEQKSFLKSISGYLSRFTKALKGAFFGKEDQVTPEFYHAVEEVGKLFESVQEGFKNVDFRNREFERLTSLGQEDVLRKLGDLKESVISKEEFTKPYARFYDSLSDYIPPAMAKAGKDLPVTMTEQSRRKGFFQTAWDEVIQRTNDLAEENLYQERKRR